jgi:integrase
MYRNFKLFMSLEMSGSFRTQTTVNLRYSQIDVKNGNVTTTAKGGGKVVIAVTTNMCQLVLEHQKWQKAQGINSDYLFPSPRNEKKCRANFDKQWTDLRVALGFVSTVKIKDKVKRKFQYRLHDFRETLLNRLQDIDDLTLSLLLGQLSTGSVKYYRKAMAENAKRAAILAERRLEEVMLARNTPL